MSMNSKRKANIQLNSYEYGPIHHLLCDGGGGAGGRAERRHEWRWSGGEVSCHVWCAVPVAGVDVAPAVGGAGGKRGW